MKKLLILLLAATLCFSFTACSNDKESTGTSTSTEDNSTEKDGVSNDNSTEEQQTEEKQELMQIDTEYGTLSYPTEWKDALSTSESNENGFLTITFTANVGGQTYTLFNVMINSKEGDSVGTIKADDGTVRNVFTEIKELPDISGLSEEDQNQLYAMQEGINVLIENLD